MSTGIKGNLFISLPKMTFCIIIISREEEIVMNIELAKKIAYTLTEEHIRQTEFIKNYNEDPETIVSKYIDLYNEYLEILKKKSL